MINNENADRTSRTARCSGVTASYTDNENTGYKIQGVWDQVMQGQSGLGRFVISNHKAIPRVVLFADILCSKQQAL
jgi:hypothetical protein